MLPRTSREQREKRRRTPVGRRRSVVPAGARLVRTPSSIATLVTTAIASIDQPSESSPAAPETAR